MTAVNRIHGIHGSCVPPETHRYCSTCSSDLLKGWVGWPHREAVPLLPRVMNGACEVCGSSEMVEGPDLGWLNYHSPFNTGLPDYWTLEVKSTRPKWGRPYLSEASCPKCFGRSVVSEMNFPNGASELRHNCPVCGVVRPRRPTRTRVTEGSS